MDKLSEAELTTLKILVQSANQQTLLAQRAQAAQQDYTSKLKVLYLLNDKDTVNLETGAITREEKPKE